MAESIKDLRKICQLTDCPEATYPFYSLFSIYVTKFFIKTKVTPNQVTFFASVLGLIGALLLLWQKTFFLIFSAAMILAWRLLDHADGEIARYKKIFSKKGYFIDLASTVLIELVILAAVTFGAWFAFGKVYALYFGIAAIFGYAMHGLIAEKSKMISREKADGKPSLFKRVYLFMRRVLLIEFFPEAAVVFSILGFADIFLLLFAFDYNLLWIGKVIYEFARPESKS